jgi:hypothetical protein
MTVPRRVMTVTAIKTLLFLCVAMIALTAAAQITGHVNLFWGYPPSDYTNTFSVNVYETTNFNAPAWNLLTNVSGAQTNILLDIQPGAHFFRLTATNFWGESDFSNTATTPPTAPLIGNTLKIEKAP